MAAKVVRWADVEYGGHDCEFVNKVPDRYICQICTKVLRDPHLAVCCGQHFCESCLNKWFTRQGKESCPHCRTEGEAFNHVIHKGLRSEVNQLKIRCTNHGYGCQWTGELGILKKHLESDNGCGYVFVGCPNKCVIVFRRRDLEMHISEYCYLRPYQCEFCGHKDTFEAITGCRLTPSHTSAVLYSGHQAKCPEVPLTCPNKCGSEKIKRKDMESHCRQCPQEPVECPFAEAGCKVDVCRHQLDNHMTTWLQQHVLLLMIDRKQLKGELSEVKAKLSKAETELCETKLKLSKAETEIDKTRLKLHEIEALLTYCKASTCSNSLKMLKNTGDSLKFTMPNYSMYCRSGKVWHSPPFYYREGYKMCLAVHANGVGEGAGTHVSVTLMLLKDEHSTIHVHAHQSVQKRHDSYCLLRAHGVLSEGQRWFNLFQYRPLNQFSKAVTELESEKKFCSREYIVSKLVNDCLTFNVLYRDEYYLIVSLPGSVN